MADKQEMTGGDAIVRILKEWGVEVVFGIISIHNIPIYDALARQGGIRVIPTRSEPGAVNMADAYARVSGGLGVAITSTGTGAGNAAGALVEAQTAGSAVLHITGQIESTYLDKGKGFIHECKDQLGMLKSISKAAYRPISANTIPQTLQTAIQQAFSAPRGVVSLEIPIDYQGATITATENLLRRTGYAPALEPTPSVLQEAVELMRQAKSPLIWAGSGVIDADAAENLRELAEKWGAGVFTSNAGRGSLPEDHPLSIGNFANQPGTRPLIDKADVLLIVGSHLRGTETFTWQLPLPPNIIQIDVDELAIGRNYPVTVGLQADAKLALAELTELLGDYKPDPAYLEEIAQTRKESRQLYRATLGPYAEIMDKLRANFDRNAIMVRDTTVPASTWGNRLLPIYEPRTSIHPAGGGIGQGFQMALGAKLAKPEAEVVAIVGDGGFMVNIGEMATAVQENLNVILVLFNDGGYGVLRNIQNGNYDGRHIAVDLHNPDFLKVAEAFGMWAKRVDKVEDFEPALQAAKASGKPAIVEVDMAAIGPMNQPFRGIILNLQK